MRNANRPSGPGKPTQARRDAVDEREELDELTDPRDQAPAAQHSARHAERDAHTGNARRQSGPGRESRPAESAQTQASKDETPRIVMWVLVADEGMARILEMVKPDGELTEVETLTDAAAHADRADLRRDAYGRRAGSDRRMGGSVTASAGDDELHREAQLFARRIAERLAEARQAKRFDHLQIVAAPRFLGQLRKVLPHEVSDVELGELNKDLIHLDARSLQKRLFSERVEETETKQ